MVYKKSISGIRWNLIINISINILQILQIVIISRYLNSSDFGIVGIVAPILTALLLMSDMGFGAALIQKKTENIYPYASTIFTIMVFVSFIISIFLFFYKEQIANFYNDERIINLIYYLIIVLFLKIYSAIVTSLAIKELEFQIESVSRMLGIFINFIISIVLAIVYHTYWALLTGYFISTVVSILYINYKIPSTRIGMKFDLTKLKEIYKFAMSLFLAKVIYFTTKTGLGLVLAKLFPQNIYGQYYFAQRLSEYPQNFFGSLINNIVFSSLSKIQSDKNRFKIRFLEIGMLVTFFIIPINLYLIFFSKEIILLIFGNKWVLAYQIFSYLMFFILFSSIGMIPAIAIQAKGYSNILLNANYLRVPFVLITLIIGYIFKFGILKITFFLVLSELPPIFYLIYKANKIINVKFIQFARYYLKPLALMCLILLLIKLILSWVNNYILVMLFSFIFSIILYFLVYYIFFRNDLCKITLVLSDILKKPKLKDIIKC